MSESFNVYQKWLGIPPHQQPPHHYRLLGIELFESDPEVIAYAADRQMAHVRTLSTGEHVKLAQQLLNDISAARVQLLNPQKKASYDAALNADLAGQQAAAQAPAGQAAATTFDSTEDEDDAPVWKHPAVIATGAVCFVLVVGICTALYLRSRPSAPDDPAAPTWTDAELAAMRAEETGEELSPGHADEIPVDPAEETSGESEPSDNSEPTTEPPPQEDPVETSPPDTNKTQESPTENPTQLASSDTKLPTGTDEPPADPDEPAPTDTEPGTETVATNTSGMPTDSVASSGTLDTAFTADDPGPPEPDEDAEPIVKKRELLPVPEADAIAKTLSEVKEIFAAEYDAAKTYEQRRALAQFLWRQAQEVRDDPVSHYVLLTESRVQAEQGGDFEFTMRLADIMERYFIINGLDLKIESLGVFSRTAKNDAGRHIVASAAVDLADEASREHQFDTAEKLATQAQSLAQRVGDNNLRQKARLLGNEIKKRRAAWATIQEAIDKLATSPDDAEAHLIYGKYLCVSEEDWEAGLPHLAQSNNPTLSKLAKQDLAEPEDTDAQIALADAWYDFAQSDPQWEKFRLREHHWYLTALPEATGLMRTKVEKRLRENPLVPFRVQWLSLPSRAEQQQSPFQ